MWRVCKAAGRPWPVIVPDDEVLDYMVMEAVALKVNREDKEDEKQKKIQQWKEEQIKELKKIT